MSDILMEIEDLKVSYGNVKALKGISLKVKKGQIITLIGANGAGKSTTMNTLSGLIKSTSGKVTFEGQDISAYSSEQLVKLGIILSPEGRQVFPRMSVYHNLMLGAYTLKDKKKIEENLNTVYDLFPKLKDREKQLAGTLSGGEQQMLAVGRALMSNPKLLMLDEPSLGLAPLIIKEMFRRLQQINEMGMTILLVEQNAKMALSISDYAYVLENGTIKLEGAGAELIKNEEVKHAYLGA